MAGTDPSARLSLAAVISYEENINLSMNTKLPSCVSWLRYEDLVRGCIIPSHRACNTRPLLSTGLLKAQPPQTPGQ